MTNQIENLANIIADHGHMDPLEQAEAIIGSLADCGIALAPENATAEMVLSGIKCMAVYYPDHIGPTHAVLTIQPKDIYKAMIEAIPSE